MPEIIGDTHLYRWNGENYVEEQICRSYKTVNTIEKEGGFDETEDGEDTESSPVKNTQTTHGVQRRNISYY